jgi:hypothetical protein
MTWTHLDCKICRRRQLEDDVLLQTGAAYVSTQRIYSLYGVILLGVDNVESRARRGKSWRKMPVALYVLRRLNVS